jgi:L-amino acid N-acyltransferase YncA
VPWHTPRVDLQPSRVRRATAHDGPACARIYASYVLGTAVTFETEPPDAGEMSRRIAAAQEAHDWLVVEASSGEGPRIVGYAYGGAFRARPAYGWTAEVSIYLEPYAVGQGLGRTLYAALIDRLEGLGYRTLVAGYTVPNEASERLHRGLGFEPVGVYRRVGVKLGAWQDVAWVQRFLGDGPPPGLDAPSPGQ